jgi:hypothetical protein
MHLNTRGVAPLLLACPEGILGSLMTVPTHYCPVVEKAKVRNTPVVIDDYRSLDLLTI